MEKIAFISGYDKADILIYISKVLTVLEKKVLIIDTTLIQKTRYIVPTMTPTLKYVTTFDGIDIAVGFDSQDEVLDYLDVKNFTNYDYVIFDIDDPYYYESFGLKPTDKHCFLGTFDVYSVNKGIDVLRSFKEPTNVLKALVTRDPESDESDYLTFATFNSKVKWNETVVFIPFDTADLYEIYQNQRSSRVKFFGLSLEFKENLGYLIENITDCNRGDIRKTIKMIEREM